MTVAFRSIAASLALCAMVLRALLPMGWMPAADIASAGPFVICSIDGAHKGGKAPDGARVHAPCAFAAAAPLAPPMVVAAVLGRGGDAVRVASVIVVARADRFVHRPQSARAPPLF